MYRHISKIETRLRNIPDLIDTKTDKYVWDMMCLCNDIIIDLVDTDIIDDLAVDMLVLDFGEYMALIRTMVDDVKYFMISLYFSVMMDYCVKYCEDNELFESCANIKNFEGKI